MAARKKREPVTEQVKLTSSLYKKLESLKLIEDESFDSVIRRVFKKAGMKV